MSTELSDTEKLHTISEATNPDGTIDVELHDFNRSEADDMVSVEFITPDGEIESEVVPWPKADDEDYKFVRIFNQTGYGIIAAEEACEQNVTIKAERDPWRINAPHNQTTLELLKEKITKFITVNLGFGNTDDWDFYATLAFAIPLMIIVFIFYPFDTDNMHDTAIGYGMALWHLFIWGMIAAGLLVLFL